MYDSSQELAVADATTRTGVNAIAATISGGKMSVSDSAAEASLATLAGTVSGGHVQVSGTLSGGTTGATTCTPVAAAAAAAALKTGTGALFAIIVTAIGTAGLYIRDGGASGTIIAYVQPNAPLGDVPIYDARPYATSLWVASGTGTPGVTVVYS